jgi:deoxyinosine 3'endonuclease (endonuclease V)
MFAAADVHYPPSGGARAALIAASDAAFSSITCEKTVFVAVVAAYQPGSFYKRAGLPAAEAADLVRAMAGKFRLPDALRRVDALARQTRPRPRGRGTKALSAGCVQVLTSSNGAGCTR